MLELDHPEFNLSDMEGLRIVMQAYQAATVVSGGAGGEGGGGGEELCGLLACVQELLSLFDAH